MTVSMGGLIFIAHNETWVDTKQTLFHIESQDTTYIRPLAASSDYKDSSTKI